jgi:ABC-type molybdate transport system permease subunit
MSHLVRGTLSQILASQLMSVKKNVASTIIVLAIIAIAAYGLFSLGGGAESGFRSLNARTLVTLAVVGGSAFITGFGLRDVIGRAVATRNRNRLKFLQEQKRP